MVNYSPLDTVKSLQHRSRTAETDIMPLDVPQLLAADAGDDRQDAVEALIVGSVAEPVPFASLLERRPVHGAPHGPLHGRGGGHPVHRRHDRAPKGASSRTRHPLGVQTSSWRPSGRCSRRAATAFLVVLPLFHIYGLSAVMVLGMRIVRGTVLHARFDAEAVVKDIAAKRITGSRACRRCSRPPRAARTLANYDLNVAAFLLRTGAPLPVELANAFEKATAASSGEAGA